MNRRPMGPSLMLSATLVVALGRVPSPASAFHEATVHVEAGALFPSLDAEARSPRFGIAGSLVTDADLGLDDPDAVLNYRYFHGQGEEGGDEANVDLSGPYASLTLAF
jgi:hypothetical protein